MNIFLDNFAELSSFDGKDLLQEFGLCVQVVLVVLAAEDLERLEYVMDIFG